MRTEARRAAPCPCFGVRTGAPFPSLPPPAQPWPPPEGRTTAQLRKGAKERNPRLGGARCCSSGPLPLCPVPTPTVPSSGRAGMRRCEGVLPCSARTKPTAGARGRAPSRWQRRAGGAELQVCAPAAEREGGLGRWGAICTLFFLDGSLLLLCTQWPVRVIQPSPLRCPAPLSSSLVPFGPQSPSFFLHLTPFTFYPSPLAFLFFLLNLFPFFFSIRKQC